MTDHLVERRAVRLGAEDSTPGTDGTVSAMECERHADLHELLYSTYIHTSP